MHIIKIEAFQPQMYLLDNLDRILLLDNRGLCLLQLLAPTMPPHLRIKQPLPTVDQDLDRTITIIIDQEPTVLPTVSAHEVAERVAASVDVIKITIALLIFRKRILYVLHH